MKNCWKKAGFIAPLPTIEPDQPDQVRDQPMPNQEEDYALFEITERKEEAVLRNIWDRLATVLKRELPDYSNYVVVDEIDTEVVAGLTDQKIVSDVKSMSEQDNPKIESESESETEVADGSMVEVQQVIDWDLNDEFMTTAGKVDKFLMFTKIHKSVQRKITDYFKKKGICVNIM